MLKFECGAHAGLQIACSSATVEQGSSFLEVVCTPFLLTAQNSDGGWPFRPGAQSAVEPTCWAILALQGLPHSNGLREALCQGTQWLQRAQLADGSWPTFPGQLRGCWATAVACLALHIQQVYPDGVSEGLHWICETWPAEGSWAWRLRNRFFAKASVVSQDSSLRGWSWTPGTASWVEPTALSLLLLHNVPERLRPRGAEKRIELGERMLYDRMCRGGGWNSGNPLVYGVNGEPRVSPTVWALLALERHAEQNRESLDWLERSYESICGPASLTLAHLCLSAYERPTPPLEQRLRLFHSTNQFLSSVQVTAWAILALSGLRGWLRPRAARVGP